MSCIMSNLSLLEITVIMIPVILLWNVKIKRSQKLLLGIFLCLSICMIMIAIVRASGLLRSNRTIDVQWEVFFQHVEASVSVTTVSLTAFRSLLGVRALNSREKKERAWYSHRRIFLLKKGRKISESKLDGDQLPSIPRATLTGMRTFIRGNRDSKYDLADLTTSGHGNVQMEYHIQVTQTMSSESEAVRFSTGNYFNRIEEIIKMLTLPDIERRFDCGFQHCLSHWKGRGQGSHRWIMIEAQAVESMRMFKLMGTPFLLIFDPKSISLPKFTSLAATLGCINLKTGLTRGNGIFYNNH